MNESSQNRRDFWQNIAITLLSLSAVVLFVQSQFYHLGANSGFFDLFSAPAAQSTQETPASTTLSAPVQVAVTGVYGRYGSVAATTADEAFKPLAQLLGAALQTAEATSSVNEQAFLDAAQTASVFYDFRTALPLPVLAGMIDAASNLSAPARQVILSAAESGVELFFWDGDARYLKCSTALSVQELEDVLNDYELGNARFAMDLADTVPAAQTLAPCALLPDAVPALPLLSSTIPYASENAQLLSALHFNPNTKFRYTDAGGTEFIEENGRTLHLRPDGTVYYQDNTDYAELRIDTAGAEPTLTECVTGTATLLRSLLGSTAGEASLCLNRIDQTQNTAVLTFDYQAYGVPIRFSDGDSAATVTLTGSTVSELTLRLRQYTSAGGTSLLLPLQQMLALAEKEPLSDLSIGYADTGSGTVSAGWLLDESR
ncbi:MAG: hypothetical protein E7429_03725 [Ruminococcaceae bacterium]|nr:hypothetical protein [Oscillospiraceae bacterium]